MLSLASCFHNSLDYHHAKVKCGSTASGLVLDFSKVLNATFISCSLHGLSLKFPFPGTAWGHINVLGQTAVKEEVLCALKGEEKAERRCMHLPRNGHAAPLRCLGYRVDTL